MKFEEKLNLQKNCCSITLDRAFIYAGGSYWNRHLAYVALTRHREQVKLYASSLDQVDLKALKVHLAREEYRDNVLDFPISYAERRGFDPESLLGRFIERVAGAKEKIKEAWLFVSNYEAFLLHKKQQQHQHNDFNTQDRAVAKLAATYLDSVRALNKDRSALSKELTGKALYNDTRYTALVKRQRDLSTIANTLWPVRDQLAEVFARNKTPIASLEQAMHTHQRFERARLYVEAFQRGNYDERRLLALDIEKDRRSHFTGLAYYAGNANISIKEICGALKQDAQSYEHTMSSHSEKDLKSEDHREKTAKTESHIDPAEWAKVKEQLHPAFGRLASSHALLQYDNDATMRSTLEREYHQSLETIYKDDQLLTNLQKIAPSVAKQVTDYGKSVPGMKIDWQSPALQAEAQKLNASEQPEAKGLASAMIQLNKETDPNMKKMTLQLLNEKVRRLVNDKTILAEISTKAPLLAKQMQAYHAREKERDRSIDR